VGTKTYEEREMLWNASAIDRYAIAASDGRLGTVCDFLFDDASWLIRWLVVDTSNWLSAGKVLLPPSVLEQLDAKEHEFSVKLTMQQVKDSPDIDTQRPVSRQMETSVYDYYGWSPYWGTGFYMGGYGYVPGAMVASRSRRREEEIAAARRTTTMCISAASQRSLGIISVPATARSVTSRTSSWRMPIGASISLSSIRRTGGSG
jgi:PRC-barrel domain